MSQIVRLHENRIERRCIGCVFTTFHTTVRAHLLPEGIQLGAKALMDFALLAIYLTVVVTITISSSELAHRKKFFFFFYFCVCVRERERIGDCCYRLNEIHPIKLFRSFSSFTETTRRHRQHSTRSNVTSNFWKK